jgi:hypothetical protein
MAMQKVGMAYIKVDGQLLESLPGAKLTLGGVKRTTVLGSNRVLGFSEQPAESMVECEIAVGPNTDLIALGESRDVTITFEPDVGRPYVIRNAWCLDPPSLSDSEGGKAPFKFAGPPADQM